MMRYAGRFLTYVWTGPWDLIVWLVALVVALLSGGRLAWQDGGLWAVMPRREYVHGERIWMGITLGHGGVLSAIAYSTRRDTTRTERHEGAHVEQFEAIALAGLVLGVIVFSVVSLNPGMLPEATALGLLIWFGAYPAVIGAGHVVALVRGEPVYLGSTFEEAARAIAEGPQPPTHVMCRCLDVDECPSGREE